MIEIDDNPVKEPYRSAHKFSSLHKELILKSKQVGCFYCCSIFDPKQIIEWIDTDQTALCPICGIDSVLPEEHFQNEQFLREMEHEWFDCDAN